MIIFLIFGGVAVDSSNAWRMRAELQATADAAAHAGVIDLPVGEAAAKTAAINFAESNMDTTSHGNVLVPSDVVVGIWDGSSFTPDNGIDANAVSVVTRRDVNNSNRLRTYFLRLIGMNSWNVSARAIAQRYFPDCLNGSAIVSAQIVDFQSNNDFYPGICIHAQDHVEVNNGNCWGDGVDVTMPSLGDFVAPPNDWEGDGDCEGTGHNVGLSDALGEEWFYPKEVDNIGNYLAAYVDPIDGAAIWPDYIGTDADGAPIPTADIIQKINDEDWDIETYAKGHVYEVTCNKASSLLKLNASEDFPLHDVVIVANCNIQVGSNGVVYNAVIGSTAGEDPKTKPWDSIIDLGAGTEMGIKGCEDGGASNVTVISTASLSGPSGTTYYGVKMLATENIHIAAQAEGVEEINIMAGGDIDWASGNSFGPVCDVPDEEDPLALPYFRLVL